MGNNLGDASDVEIAIEDFEEDDLINDNTDEHFTVGTDAGSDEMLNDYEENPLPPLTETNIVALPDGTLAEELNYEEAGHLTTTIRNAANMLWFLILKAYHGKAWKVLGYKSWGDYVTEEFDMSRSRSYQILDQAKVIQAIESVTPDGTNIELNEATARDLKGVLDEVLPEIQQRTADLTPEEAQEVLHNIVNETRETLKSGSTDQGMGSAGDEAGFEVDEWGNIITAEGNYPHPQMDNVDLATVNEVTATRDGGDSGEPWNDPKPFDTNDGSVSSADPAQGLHYANLKNYAEAAQNVYVAVASLTDLPHDIDNITDVISDEWAKYIDDNLDIAEVNFALFVEKWKNRKRN